MGYASPENAHKQVGCEQQVSIYWDIVTSHLNISPIYMVPLGTRYHIGLHHQPVYHHEIPEHFMIDLAGQPRKTHGGRCHPSHQHHDRQDKNP